ncbi:MAG: ribosome biogenesis GTPase Der, partial [Candidatus Marinimicrobia bacterium CG_4_9_14_3_um_filter_48_9]
QKVMDTILALHEEYHKKISTRQLNLFLNTLMTKRQPPAVKGKEISL